MLYSSVIYSFNVVEWKRNIEFNFLWDRGNRKYVY